MPQTVCHIIDKTSPLYNMSAHDLLERRFEIVLSLNGVNRHTGYQIQDRTSYLPHEVLWGHRFVNAISYDHQEGSYLAHIEKLDDVVQVDTPLCSAQRLDEILNEIHDREMKNGRSIMKSKELQEFKSNEVENDDDDDDKGILMKDSEDNEVVVIAPGSGRRFSITKVL